MSSINTPSGSIVSIQKQAKRVTAENTRYSENPEVQKGFTLLEILLALFISSIVLSIIYAAYTGTFRNINETESQSELYQMARVTLERMKEDLESVYLPPPVGDEEFEEEGFWSTGFLGKAVEIDGRSADTLRFLSTAHLVFDEEDKEAGVAQIVYDVIESGEEEEGFVLYRSDRSEFEQGVEEEEGAGLVLCEGIRAIDLIYYDDKGQDYEGWDSMEVEEEGRLPARVSIVLEFVNKANPEAPLRFVTGVALPMAMGEYEKES
jgi:general secretion pathway protein J